MKSQSKDTKNKADVYISKLLQNRTNEEELYKQRLEVAEKELEYAQERLSKLYDYIYSYNRLKKISRGVSIYPIPEDIFGEFGKSKWDEKFPGTTYGPVASEEYFGERWPERINDEMLPIPSNDPAFLILEIIKSYLDLRGSEDYGPFMNLYEKLLYRKMKESEYSSIVRLEHPILIKVITSIEKKKNKTLFNYLEDESARLSKRGFTDAIECRGLKIIRKYAINKEELL